MSKTSTGYGSTGDRSTGHYSTGHYSTGNRSTGDHSTGNRSTGYCSTGNRSTGNYSTGYGSTGHFSTGYGSTGDHSTGDHSTGDHSTGDHSTGDRSTGYFSTGDHSTGNWSIADCSAGHFATTWGAPAGMFNQPMTKEELENVEFPGWLYTVKPATWVKSEYMTDEEKAAHPDHKVTGGYLKIIPMKEAWRTAWDAAPLDERRAMLELPHWDNAVFLEVSGIDVEAELKPKLPVFDPEICPKWMAGYAMDSDGKWYLYTGMPYLTGSAWRSQWSYVLISEEHAPKFEGDWKDSWIVNPDYKGE